MNWPAIKVSDEAFPYLRAQKGKLDELANDRSAWLDAYRADLERSLGEMHPYLPERCWAFLDIGSGLGGIDILIARHYTAMLDVTSLSDTTTPRLQPGDHPFVYLLDGVNDPPKMKLHRQTFSNEQVARSFLRANGVRADRIRYYGPDSQDITAPYDLVLSLGSWCFHYEPKQYLPRLLAGGGLHEGTRVIVDLRRGKPEWERQLFGVGLRALAIVRESPKFRRIVFVRE